MRQGSLAVIARGGRTIERLPSKPVSRQVPCAAMPWLATRMLGAKAFYFLTLLNHCSPMPPFPSAVITELDIARSLLANQRHQEQLELDGQPGLTPGRSPGPVFNQQLVAFPVRLGSLQYVPEVGGEGQAAGRFAGGKAYHLSCKDSAHMLSPPSVPVG